MATELLPLLLVVDDDPKNLHSSKRILSELDITVHTAASGEEALKSIINHDYFLILMDVQMPGMDGFETVSMIRGTEKYQTIPIIFLTAISKEEAYIEAGYNEGAVDYLFKPINSHTLRCKTKVFLDLYLANIGLVNAKLVAEHANKEKSTLITNISHEIRTPLTVVNGILKLMASGVLADKSQEEIKSLAQKGVNNCEHLMKLVDELLDIKKTEEGKVEYNIENQLLVPIVHKAICIVEDFAKENEVSISFNSTDIKDVKVDIDAQRLVQVIINFITNAVKFTNRQDNILIEIVQTTEQSTLSVIDHGNGIPLEHQPKIFTEFFQADTINHSQVKGSGLGLSLCKRLIEAMGASIGFESIPGEGTRFFIVFNQNSTN